jgi:hypothetical protein
MGKAWKNVGEKDEECRFSWVFNYITIKFPEENRTIRKQKRCLGREKENKKKTERRKKKTERDKEEVIEKKEGKI